MTENEYTTKRIHKQINWYNRKSSINKKYFYSFQLILIILAILITISGTLNEQYNSFLRFILPIIGGLIGIISGGISLFKFQEKWIEYRTTAESLIKEQYLFQTKSGPYNIKDSFNLYVSRCESIISNENRRWQNYAYQTNND